MEREYQGIFFDEKNKELLRNNLNKILIQKGSKPLEINIKDLHITFWYGPEKYFEAPLKEYEISIVGFGLNNENCAFQVDIPNELLDEYKSPAIPHITMQVSKGGKAINSRYLDYEKIEPFIVKGKPAYVIDNNVVYLKKNMLK